MMKIKKSKQRKVAIIDHTESRDGRVDNLVNYFEMNNFKVNVITSNFSHYTKRKITNVKPDYIYLPVLPYYKNVSLRRIISHIEFSVKTKRIIDKGKYDLVWVLAPPNSLIKSIINKKSNFRTVVDLQDLWPESMPISKRIKKSFPFRIWANLRDKNLEKATYIVTECKLYKQYIPKKVLNKVSTLYLAKEYSNFITTDTTSRDKIRIAYLGSINNIIDLQTIYSIILKFATYSLVEFIIIGDGEKRVELVNMIKSIPNVKVCFYGKIFDSKQKDKILRSCNFGINLMKDNLVVGLTMKSMDYLKNGLPLINNIKGDTHSLVKSQDIGFNMDDENINIKEIIKKSKNINYKNHIIDVYNRNFSLPVFYRKLDSILIKLFQK